MQNLFPGYYPPVDAELTELWSKGTIVLDTNVLLNLYRYPETARNELLDILRSVRERLWVPHHAALEFHRNRLTVVAEQKRRFFEVRELALKTKTSFSEEISKLKLTERHALISPESVVEKVGTAIDEFVVEIDELEGKHIDVHKADAVRSSLVELLDGRVGAAPDQAYLDRIYREAQIRYQSKTPPGYMDTDKAKSPDPIFSYGGLQYERQHGDLIIWNQILDYAREENVTRLMFITDDDKEDWWYIVKSSGSKTIGPRPELVEEAKRLTSLDVFHMYKSYGFMVQSKVYLKSKVSANTIEQVEALSRVPSERATVSMVDSEHAVHSWLIDQHPGWELEETFLPDFTIRSPNEQEVIGVEIVRPKTGKDLFAYYKNRQDMLRDLNTSGDFRRIDIAIVVPDVEASKKGASKLSSVICDPGFGLILGHLDYEPAGEARFVPSLRLSGTN